ncbi:MAG: DNA replication/repair protein RecF [Clostridia bacterium]|nr:DNA replication/repair protein RecF [Clostridia bacterium]
MTITNIKLKNFRNYEYLKINLGSGINILTGKNAQGKTNLIEAVYLCCVGKSFRGKDKELILKGQGSSTVEVNALKAYGQHRVKIYLSQTENKKILINDIPVLKTGELLGGINAVYFSPDELKLVKDAPACRRKFLDVDISQINKKYFYTLISYNKILQQRNNVLKSSQKSLRPMLEIYDEQLASAGSYIISSRMEFISSIYDDVKKIHKTLSHSEELEISYQSSLSLQGDIKQNFLNNLKSSREKDLKLGYTTVGPHRDDIKILLSNLDVKIYGSQGQQRTCALSIKLSELNYYKKITGEYPLLLLDDVFSELDIFRRKRLLSYCDYVQTIITTTENIKDLHNNTTAVYSVNSGSIAPFFN